MNEVSDRRVSRAYACMTASVTLSASWTTAKPLPASGTSVKTSSTVRRWAPTALLVEVEAARRLLLEPEPVVLRRLLEELRRLLEDVLVPRCLRGGRLLVLVLEPGLGLRARVRGLLDARRGRDRGRRL